jgi:hypothetical protein
MLQPSCVCRTNIATSKVCDKQTHSYSPLQAPKTASLALPPPPKKQGVGSHAAHMLLRSGVGRLRLVDFDQVTLSSLNRHAVAVREDVGIAKSTCLGRHFKQILPEVRFARHQFFRMLPVAPRRARQPDSDKAAAIVLSTVLPCSLPGHITQQPPARSTFGRS